MSEQSQQSGNFSLFDDPIIFWSLVAGAIYLFVAYLEPGIFFTPWKSYAGLSANLIQLFYYDPAILAKAAEIERWVQVVHPKDIDGEQFSYVNGIIGDYLRYHFLVALVALGLYARHVTSHLKKHKLLNLEELIEKESKIWKPLKFYVKHNPLKHSPDKGAFSSRVKPWEWAKQHKVLRKATIEKNGEQESLYFYDDKKVKSLLIDQLGDRCVTNADILKQNIAYQCVLLMALNRIIDKDTKKGYFHNIAVYFGRIQGEDALLGYISDHYASSDKEIEQNKEVFANTIREKLSKALDDKKVKGYLLPKHAYANTLIIRAVLEAREFGIMPSSWFPFLHTEDKLLNFIVNDIGRKPASIVCAGVFSHYLAETDKGVNRAVVEPWVDGVELKSLLVKGGLPISSDSN